MRFKGATRRFVLFFHVFASLSRRINSTPPSSRFCRSCEQFTTWTRPGQRESTTVLTNGSPPRNPRWSHGWLSRGLRRLIRQCPNPVTKLLLSTPTSGPYVRGHRFDESLEGKEPNCEPSFEILQTVSQFYDLWNYSRRSIDAALFFREWRRTFSWREKYAVDVDPSEL